LEAGLVNLNSLPDREAQDAVLRALFDRKAGAGFSVMKTVIGATDFQAASQEWYTYDDTPGDTKLSLFSISRDLGPNGLITYIKRARKAGGEFQLQAPMDYPPDWMLYDAGSRQEIDPAYYRVLARYFVKYLNLYEKNGVHIDYLSPFNEPGTYTKISFAQIRDFIRDYLGPAFAARGITTRIQFSDIGSRGNAADNYPLVLDDEVARRYIAALPYHGYDWAGWDRITALQAQYPDLPLWMTEICCAIDQASGMKFESGDFWGNQIFSDMEAGASAWIYWNAILNEQGGPWLNSPVHGDPDPNSQNSVVVIDSNDHTVTYTGLYYYLAHFSKFVRPGARRIATTGAAEEVRAVSFQNANGSRVSELINSRADPVEVQLDWHGLSLVLTLPGTSITTVQWDG
jgi:glucosylceramidase